MCPQMATIDIFVHLLITKLTGEVMVGSIVLLIELLTGENKGAGLALDP